MNMSPHLWKHVVIGGVASDHRIIVAKFTSKDYRMIWALWARLLVNN